MNHPPVADTRAVGNVEARKITDKRHGYRGRVSLIDPGNGSEKARIKLALDLGWLVLPDGFGRPRARFRFPSFLETPGEQDAAKTTSALEQILLQNSQNAVRSISRKWTKRAAIADRCRLQAITEDVI
jgi:hypothetical protein